MHVFFFLFLLSLLLAVETSCGLLIPSSSSPSSSSSSLFQTQVEAWLRTQSDKISFKHQAVLEGSRGGVLTLNRSNTTTSIALHLVPTPTSSQEVIHPHFKRDWTNRQQKQKQKQKAVRTTTNNTTLTNKVIHLHQDIWESKREIVQCRLLANLGQSRRIFARKTVAKKINATFAMEFLEDHHLWGATRAKHYYGLFLANKEDANEEELVAVATFSNRRKVHRGGVPYKSHELLRFCALRNSNVVGGISKLIQRFVRDYDPDDLVTVVDRDWGDGSGWHAINFETVEVLDPNIMVVQPAEVGIRRHLVGAGISHDNPNKGRLGLSPEILDCLNKATSAAEGFQVLEQFNYFPVYDSGVERLLKVIKKKDASSLSSLSPSKGKDEEKHDAAALWETSEPKYASAYYSENAGISMLLKYAAETSEESVKLNGDAAENNSTFLSREETNVLESWRSSSRSSPDQKILFSVPSSLDPTAMVEIRDRGNGWRTIGIQGGVTKSIFHSIYKVDPATNQVDPTAVVLEYVKTMVAAFLGSSYSNSSPSFASQRPVRMAHFGVGSGTLMYLMAHEFPHSYHVAVEIDSGVVAAVKQLPLPSNCEIREEDALLAFRHPTKLFDKDKDEDEEHQQQEEEPSQFDAVLIDVFDEKLLHPPAFYSTGYLEHLRSNVLLGESGVVVCNLHSGGKRREACIRDASEAYSKVFQSVLLFDSVDSRPNGGNTILVASPSGALNTEDMTRNVQKYQQEHPAMPFDLSARLMAPRQVPPPHSASS